MTFHSTRPKHGSFSFCILGALSCHVRDPDTLMEKPHREAMWRDLLKRKDPETTWREKADTRCPAEPSPGQPAGRRLGTNDHWQDQQSCPAELH